MWEQNVLVFLLQIGLGALSVLVSLLAPEIWPLFVVPLWVIPIALMCGTLIGMFARAYFEGKSMRNYLGRSLCKVPSVMPYLVWAAFDLAISAWLCGWEESAALVLSGSLVGFVGWAMHHCRHPDPFEPRWLKVLAACPFLGVGAIIGGIGAVVWSMSKKRHLQIT